jgi:RNA polymerase sigma-70 factor (ECF subfamily)
LRSVPEPYRSTVVLRDLEEMSYEEIAEIMEVSLGTVKSRLTRGREALKQRLMSYVREVGAELGLKAPVAKFPRRQAHARHSTHGAGAEVAS